MKNLTKTAKTISGVAKLMADKACGSASVWGTYQPKEPKKLQK